MAKAELKMPLPKLDDLFKDQDERNEDKLEKVMDISLDLIDDFPNHPFKVINNDDMEQMKQSIIDNGVLSPVLVRQKEDGRYEMISGHRRKFASQLALKETIPCIVRNLSDDEATVIMVDSNMQREEILPSEKAFAYKMKFEALSHQGMRNDLTSGQVVQKLEVSDLIGKENDESGRQVRRFIRLTNLIPELLEMVDNKKIAFNPAVELSYLKEDEQYTLLDCIEYNEATPSHAQAIKLKEMSKSNLLTSDDIDDIISEEKPNQIPKVKLNGNRMKNVLPNDIEGSEVEDYVVKSVEYYRNFESKVKKELPSNLTEKDVDNFMIQAIRHYSANYKQKQHQKDAVR